MSVFTILPSMRKLFMPVTGFLVFPYSVTAPLARLGVYLVVYVTREGGKGVFREGSREELALALLLRSASTWLRHPAPRGCWSAPLTSKGSLVGQWEPAPFQPPKCYCGSRDYGDSNQPHPMTLQYSRSTYLPLCVGSLCDTTYGRVCDTTCTLL